MEAPQPAEEEVEAAVVMAGGAAAGQGKVDGQEGCLVLEAGLPDHVIVNDIQLTATNRLTELRAASLFFGITSLGAG